MLLLISINYALTARLYIVYAYYTPVTLAFRPIDKVATFTIID